MKFCKKIIARVFIWIDAYYPVFNNRQVYFKARPYSYWRKSQLPLRPGMDKLLLVTGQ